MSPKNNVQLTTRKKAYANFGPVVEYVLDLLYSLSLLFADLGW